MLCMKCGSSAMVRVAPRGFLQLIVFPLFGRYPWKCLACHRTLAYCLRFDRPDLNDIAARSRLDVEDTVQRP